MHKMPFVWIVISSLLLLIPSMANTEEEAPLELEELTIQVLPEYSYHPKDKEKDHASLLVGYHGFLRNKTDEPQKGKIEIPLPVGERNFQIGFVGDYSKDLKEMYEIKYELDKNTGIISWETSEEIDPQGTYKFVIEFYTDSLQVTNEKKTLDYHFKSFTDIGLVNLIFVEPLNTESFTLDPVADSHLENSFGMNMFIYMIQGMKAGEEKNVRMEYVRKEERTSVEIMEEMAGEFQQRRAAVKNEDNIPAETIILTVGSLSVVGAALQLFMLRKRQKKTGPGRHADEQVPTYAEIKKAKLRAMLLNGSITEEEYHALLRKGEGE